MIVAGYIFTTPTPSGLHNKQTNKQKIINLKKKKWKKKMLMTGACVRCDDEQREDLLQKLSFDLTSHRRDGNMTHGIGEGEINK